MNSDLSDGLKELVARYAKEPSSFTWPQKRSLAEQILKERRDFGIPESQYDLRQVVLAMAKDEKWEVRRVAAELLPFMPDDDFQTMASTLALDANAYVKRTAERGLGRRRQAAKAARKVRKAVNQVDEMLDALEKQFGPVAAGRARKISDKHSELLVGAIAHDLRNMLTALKADVTAHLGASGTKAGKSGSPDRIMEGFEFLEGAVSDMSHYAQELPAEMAMEDLAATLRAGAEMARSALEDRGCDISGVSLTIEAEPDLQVEMARRLIVLATSHVVKNAIEAFLQPDGSFNRGSVRIRAAQHGGQAVVNIVNDGPGLDEEDLTDLRSFLPGRKNKMKQTSRGFGLPTACRYILHHGGSMEINSPGGLGAVVTLRLPVTQNQRTDA